MSGARRWGRRRCLDEQVRDLQEQVDAAQVVLRSLLDELAPDDPGDTGTALRVRLEHGLLHAEALAAESSERTDKALADLRSSTRLTQALVERALAPPATLDAPPPASSTSVVRSFQHVAPSFDLLYRAFEDRHRGTMASITDRLRDDYLTMIQDLPAAELPVADLGCGRGELVQLLDRAQVRATGVDANLGQLGELSHGSLVNQDLFDWLDEQPDASHRAVTAIHVVEHLPLDLQVRLVFEARRVLVDGGLLVLETPNVLSLSTAATNFWVDPTHHRPVHPLFLEFLAVEAGFGRIETHQRHPVPVHFRGGEVVPELVEDLDSLILGAGDLAFLAWR